MRRRERLYRLVGSTVFPREWWKRHGGEVTGTSLQSPAPARELATLVPAGLSVRTRGYETNARGHGWVVDGARFGVLIAMVVGLVACQATGYLHPARLADSTLAHFVSDVAWLGAIVAVGRRRDTLGAVFIAVPAALCGLVATGARVTRDASPLRDVPVGSLGYVAVALYCVVAGLLVLRVWSRGIVRRRGSLWWGLTPFVLAGVVKAATLAWDDTPRVRVAAPLVVMGLFGLVGLVRLGRDPSWAVGYGLAFAAHGLGTLAWVGGRLAPGSALVLAFDALATIALWSGAALAPRLVAVPGRPPPRRRGDTMPE
ncbi:MAG: hypothetical protein KDC33_13140 [Thermoleophilia bacterium]|nr:hypothetical protein [Thermoleophilia bacterium]